MTLVVCGNVDPAAVEAEVLKTWGKAKGKAIRSRRRHLVDRSGFATQPKLKDTLAFPVNSVRWAAALPAVSLKDDKLALLDLATTILGAGASSRLHQRLYRKENVVTSVSCSVWAPYAQGLLSFDVEAPPEKAALFMKPLWQEVDRFAEEGPTEEELTKAKNQLESERIYAMQNMEGMAYRLGYMKLSSGDVKFDLNYLNQVREASADDVKDAFKGLLQGKLQEYVLVPNGFDSSVVWSQYDRGRPVEAKKQSVAQERRDQKIKHQSPLLPRLVSLPNGIDLLLIQRNDVPVVSINAAILGGTRYETPQTSGLGYLLSNVWDKAPRGWTAEHTAHFLESRASRISAFSGRNSMGLSASTLTKYLADILPVYVDTLFAPALDEEEFSREKTVLLEDIKTYDDQPTRLIDRLFCESLFEGHPYSWPVIGREKTIKDADHSSIKNHFTRSIAQRVVVAVSGKFQENKLIQAFEKIQRNVVVDQKPSAKAKFPVAQRFVEVAKNREQSHIIHGYPGLTVCEKDRHQLRVLLTVLGGQSGRLFTELRDKQGLCYVVSPYSMEGLDPGYVAVYMGCDPKKRTVALEGIQRELDRLAKRSVSTGELQRAKEFLLGRHHMDMQMNSTLASVVSLNTLYGLGHDAHLTLENEMKSVSARSISDFAKKLLDRPAVTAIVV
jgi:zinc protease